MSGIKYYQLRNDEELPDEFCVVRDVNGEPEEYAWYEPMDSFDRKLWNIFKESDWVAASEYHKLKAENAKLREERDRYKVMFESVHATAGELRRVRYEWKRDREQNAKLRELAHLVAEYVSADQCEGCVAKRACNAGELDMCWIRKAILEKLRELGVEVD